MRHRSLRLTAATAAAGVLLVACGGDEAADEPTAATSTEVATADDGGADTAAPTEEATTAAPTGEPTEDGATAAGATGELAAITATAPDGSTFTLGDFAGQPVLVETFATWCSTCRTQLGDTQVAAVEAGDDAAFLVLSVEQDLDPSSLDAYAEENGFTAMRFGVLDGDSLLALQERFGGAVLTPPSTPKFRVAPDGAVSDLTTGLESAEEILASLGT